jgi:hypothetical protein
MGFVIRGRAVRRSKMVSTAAGVRTRRVRRNLG